LKTAPLVLGKVDLIFTQLVIRSKLNEDYLEEPTLQGMTWAERKEFGDMTHLALESVGTGGKTSVKLYKGEDEKSTSARLKSQRVSYLISH